MSLGERADGHMTVCPNLNSTNRDVQAGKLGGKTLRNRPSIRFLTLSQPGNRATRVKPRIVRAHRFKGPVGGSTMEHEQKLLDLMRLQKEAQFVELNPRSLSCFLTAVGRHEGARPARNIEAIVPRHSDRAQVFIGLGFDSSV